MHPGAFELRAGRGHYLAEKRSHPRTQVWRAFRPLGAASGIGRREKHILKTIIYSPLRKQLSFSSTPPSLKGEKTPQYLFGSIRSQKSCGTNFDRLFNLHG